MRKAAFIPPMLLLRTEKLREGSIWRYEIKLDGYRAIAYKSHGKLYLRSRNDKDSANRYPKILQGMTQLPDETVIDGEVVALDQSGRPSFNALQNSASADLELVYYVFDVMILEEGCGRRTFRCPESTPGKKELQAQEPVRYSATLDASLSDLIRSVKLLDSRVWSRRAIVDMNPVCAPAPAKDAHQPGTGICDQWLRLEARHSCLVFGSTRENS
jgi:bifunctional non-homologous end joining protein LigD